MNEIEKQCEGDGRSSASKSLDIPVKAFDNRGPIVFPDFVQADLDWNRGQKTIGTLRQIAPLALWETEKPFCLTLPLPLGQPTSNVIAESRSDIHFCDVRGREQEFSLDRHGFAFAIVPPISVEIDDTKAVEEDYVREIEEFLKAKMGADMVYIFDYTVKHQIFKFIRLLIDRYSADAESPLERTIPEIFTDRPVTRHI